jgi:hypothetical protein
VTTDVDSDSAGATYILLFGGRDNKQKIAHVPKTYDVKLINGSIQFVTYDEKPVDKCNDPKQIYYTEAEQTGCNFSTAGTQDFDLAYNDVWAYKLCSKELGERNFDGPCESGGWEIWHNGAPEGGCSIELGIKVCTVPSERYDHASTMFNDGTLYVYGGFSKRCQDFCDDMWFFDIYIKSWREIYATGALTTFFTDTYYEVIISLDPNDVPVLLNADGTASSFAGPGRRWRHTMVQSKEFPTTKADGTVQRQQNFALYGGHRLWHGYSQENSQGNNWGSYITRQNGGYLDDLWIYTKDLDFDTVPGSTFKKNNGRWKKLEPVEQCFPNAGLSWDSRFDIKCIKTTPVGRAGHGSAYDDSRQRVWIFGGHTSYYPYLKTDGAWDPRHLL